MTTPAAEVLTDHIYRERPQVRRRRAIWNMIGRFQKITGTAISPGHRIYAGSHRSVRPSIRRCVEDTGSAAACQHRDECGKQRHQKACIQEVRCCDDLCGGRPRWGSGGVFAWNDVSVEAEKNRAEIGF